MMSNWTAASSDCSRPANNYVRVNTVDLYTPNARFTPERLGYQVLTLFGKLGYSQKNIAGMGDAAVEPRLQHVFDGVSELTAGAPQHDDVRAMVVGYRLSSGT